MTRENFHREAYYYNRSQNLLDIGDVVKRYATDNTTHYYKVAYLLNRDKVFLTESGSPEPIDLDGSTIDGIPTRDFFHECFPVPMPEQASLRFTA